MPFRVILKKDAQRALNTWKAARNKERAALWLYLKLNAQRREKKSDFAEKKMRLRTHYPNETLDGDDSSEEAAIE